jgi:DNA-binding MarR family transcriptional regulator
MKSSYAIDSGSASIAKPPMQHSQTHLRTRPISAGHLRAFEAVARHLNFRAAAEEMALTQSAVSRQIQSLEEEIGVSLFLRHTRAVELTSTTPCGRSARARAAGRWRSPPLRPSPRCG